MGAFSAPVFAILKLPLASALASLLRLQPSALAGNVIPLGAFPLFLGAAMIFGYLGGVLGGLLHRRRAGIVIGGLLGGLVTNLIFTLQ